MGKRIAIITGAGGIGKEDVDEVWVVGRNHVKNQILSERVNLFEPNVYIQFLVQIEGNVSPEALKNAVEKAYTVNEATMSKIVLEENGEAYYEKMRRSGCKAIIREGDFQEIIRENEKLPFGCYEYSYRKRSKGKAYETGDKRIISPKVPIVFNVKVIDR
ncbi:MAG: hypothetical protein HDR01_11060 [Lachnospiraceae bacterium]|nr:hypothetical protein [Lachnospiraceae bacterium]